MMTPHIYLTVALAAGLLLSVTDAAPAGQVSSELEEDFEKTNAYLTKNKDTIDARIQNLPEELKEWGVPDSALDGVDLKKLQAMVDKTIQDLPKLESEVDWSQMEKSAEEFKQEMVKEGEELLHCVLTSLKSDPWLTKEELNRVEKYAQEFIANLPEVEKQLESPAAWKKVAQMAQDWVNKHQKQVEQVEQVEEVASTLDWHEIAKYEWWLAAQATKFAQACLKGEQYSITVPLKKAA